MSPADICRRWEKLTSDLNEVRIKSKQEFQDFGYVTTATDADLQDKLTAMKTALIIEEIREQSTKPAMTLMMAHVSAIKNLRDRGELN